MKPISVAHLERSARPAIDALVRALAKLQLRVLNEVRDAAIDTARAQMEAVLAPAPAPAPAKAKAKAKAVRRRAPKQPMTPPRNLATGEERHAA